MADGIALAATAMGDRDAAAARPGLSEALAAAATARLALLGGATRAPALRALADTLRPRLDDTLARPPRAAAILAPDAPRRKCRGCGQTKSRLIPLQKALQTRW